ncbi:MAG: HAD-IA family hydrolase [Hyphomicrobiaceae bacterium]|nr:HAD-IA family hydrolase [Hyphomicrobiaceae bacterium]
MRLIIFDCDGTLVDSQHIIVAAMTRAFHANGLGLPMREAILSIVGLSLPLAVARLMPGGSEPRAVERVAEAYREAFGELRRDPCHQEPMFPGALEAVRELGGRPDVLLGVATGKSRRGVAGLFERFGIASHFVTIQTADTHPSKPHPSMILTAMAEVGGRPEETVMIGDTTYDIEMARAAGVGAIGVGWGYHPTVALEAAGAHVIVARCQELAGAVDRRFGASGAVA